jgi:hypothetical protein
VVHSHSQLEILGATIRMRPINYDSNTLLLTDVIKVKNTKHFRD